MIPPLIGPITNDKFRCGRSFVSTIEYSSVFNPIMPTGPATIPSLTAHTFPYASYFRFHLRLARAHECVRVLPSAAFARSTPPSAHYILPCTIFSPIHGVPILTRSPSSSKHPRNKLLLLLFRYIRPC